MTILITIIATLVAQTLASITLLWALIRRADRRR
jgi:hypothetical protein